MTTTPEFPRAPAGATPAGYPEHEPPGPTPRNRIAAGALGALDGLAQGLEENDVADTTDRAFAETTAVVAGVERGVHRSGWAKSGKSGKSGRGRRGRPAHPVSRPMRRARRVVRHAIERTQSGAHAAAETGRRALRAPPLVANDLKQAATSYGMGWAKGIVFYAIAGVVAIVAFACLTAGFVIGLSILIGAPWGAFVVAGAYVVVALVFVNKAGKTIRRGQRDGARHVGDAKRRIHDVAEPLRRWRDAPRAHPSRRAARRRAAARRPTRSSVTPAAPTATTVTASGPPAAPSGQVTFIAIDRPTDSSASSRPSSSSSRSMPGVPGDQQVNP